MNTRIILSAVILSSILLTCSVNPFLSQTASAQESPDADDIRGSSLEKFDAGLYAKLQDIESEQGASGAAGAKDGPYCPLLIMADKGPGGSYETASQNKQAIVSLLESYGAKNIHAAGTLSFVTADVPVSKINELSASLAVHIVGDGEGDTISYALSGAPAFVRLTESVGDDNGAATLEIDIAGVPEDVYLFEITASDSYGNDESYDYALVVSGI